MRKYYDFTDVDTDRYVINGVKRQVMLSARELALEQNPNASGWVNQRIIFTHGVGRRWCRSTRSAARASRSCSSATCRRASVAGAPTIDRSRGSTSANDRPSYIVVGAQQNEFDYPTGESDTDGSIGTETRWTGTTGIALDNTLMRLLFAARFRDLDLLISDQVTGDSQLLFHRSLSDRLSLIAPFLRFDKDPYLVIDDGPDGLRPGRVHDVATASRTPRASTRRAARRDRARDDDFNYIRNSVKITVDAYDGTMHFYVSDPDDPIIRAYQGVFPTLFEPIARCRPTSPPPARPRGAVQRPDQHVRALPRHQHPAVLPDATTCGRCRRARRASRRCRPRPTTSRCGCPTRRASSSCCSSRWSRPAART